MHQRAMPFAAHRFTLGAPQPRAVTRPASESEKLSAETAGARQRRRRQGLVPRDRLLARRGLHATRQDPRPRPCRLARHNLGRRGKIVSTAAASRHEVADRLEVTEGNALPLNSLATTSMLADVNGSHHLADRVRADVPAGVSRTTRSSKRCRGRRDHRRPASTADAPPPDPRTKPRSAPDLPNPTPFSVCPTYQVSAAPAERQRGRRLLQTVVGRRLPICPL